jgi:UDP:flavonoid glycosyltransferase YjiC (YdhE family)
MARIVLTCWGSHGDVDPYLALARGLRARGHTPIVAAPAFYRDVVAAAGVDFHPVRPAVDPTDAALLRRVMDPRRGSEVVLRELVMGAVDEAHADLDAVAADADLLVSHPVTVAAPVVAERRRLRWASTVLAPVSFWSRHEPPVLPPAPWLKDAERLAPWLGRAVIGAARLATRDWSEPVYRLRARLGLPRGGNPMFEGQHAPALVLALFSRVLGAPQPDWPPQAIVTGQPVYDAPHGTALAPALAAFLDDGEPPLVFTLGTSAVLAPGAFYAESLAAARRLGRRAVLLVGREREAAYAATTSGGDAIAVAAAPHSLLFPRAAVVVQHCGVGTLGQGLRAGRPILAVPFAHDQPDNAWRAARLGMARVLPPPRYRAPRVAIELARLLDDPSYASSAAQVAARVREEDGVATACTALERLLEAPSPARVQ